MEGFVSSLDFLGREDSMVIALPAILIQSTDPSNLTPPSQIELHLSYLSPDLRAIFTACAKVLRCRHWLRSTGPTHSSLYFINSASFTSIASAQI